MNCLNTVICQQSRLSRKYLNRDEFTVQYGILMHDRIISPRGEFGPIKLVLKPPLFIEVSVPSHENERSCICVLGVLILPLCTNFGTVSTLWGVYCFTSVRPSVCLSVRPSQDIFRRIFLSNY